MFRSRAEAQEPEPGEDISAAIVSAARDARPLALSALAADPLLPKAHALLAIASENDATRSEIARMGQALNRRDVTLQGVILQNALAEGDYDATFGAINRILRVSPERSDEFYPVLTDALLQDGAAPALSRLASDPPLWFDGFLLFAVERDASLLRLASVRRDVDVKNADFDRRLVRRLSITGEFATAQEIYRLASASRETPEAEAEHAIRFAYPPFDWDLANEGGLRARPTRDEKAIRFTVRRGRNGTVMQRFIEAPKESLQLRIEHDLKLENRIEPARVQASCGWAEQPFFDTDLVASPARYAVPVPSGNCDFVRIRLFARPVLMGAAFSGEIKRFDVERR
ncbi:MAG: hypothetical protein AAF494_02720 [Pseudomonadota bacterium]